MMQHSLLGWVLAATLALTIPAGAEETVTVAGVPEGDRLLVKRGGAVEEVRLYAVDCPEPGQDRAEAAKDFVARKALNQEVTLTERARDQQDKAVVTLALADGTDLGTALLEAGLGWWDAENVPDHAAYKGGNAKAIASGTGLFADATALAPWDYRKSHGLPPVSYRAEPEAAPAPAPAEEPKVLSASGTGLYEERPPIDASQFKVDKDLDYMALIPKHNPRMATDANGRPIGLTADNIGEIPYARELGLQDGDIISSVNGNPITDLAGIMPLVQQLRGAKQLNVTVMRNGKPVPFVVNLP
jgi:endonuclease YncB( thermonuclease family)